jgi:hypothetical protein
MPLPVFPWPDCGLYPVDLGGGPVEIIGLCNRIQTMKMMSGEQWRRLSLGDKKPSH